MEVTDVSLKIADYIVMALYMVGLIAMGFYYRKFAQEDLEHYFLAGRKFKGWMSGTSYAVTSMNADVAPAYCGMTVITGVWIYWWYISRFGLALMIGGILFAVFWRRLKIFTSPEFYEMRFSGMPAITMRSWVSIRSAFIAVVAWTGAGLLGMAKVSEALMGWSRLETFAMVIPIIIFYVILSGYIGVVVSDIFQTVIMIFSSLLLMGFVWADFGGPGGLYASLIDQFGQGVVDWKPPTSHELLGVVGIIAWTIGTAVGYGGDVAPMAGAMEGQRLLSCKNDREASKMYIWTQIVLFFMLAVLTLPALGAMVKWPGLHSGEINKELAYGMLLGHYLPTGILGLALVAMFASIMSTVDSNMNFGAQVFINDIYRRSIKRNASMKHYMGVGKVVMLVIIVFAIVVATQAQNVIDISIFMLGLSSAELTANWGQWWWWRFNGAARLTASFGGPLIFLLNKFVIFKYLINAGQDTTYFVVLTSIVLTCIAWIVVSFLTKPESEDVLIEFYKRTRPMGRWGPIARKAGIKPLVKFPIFKGMGIAVLGSVMVAAGIVAFSAFYISRWWIASFAVIIAVPCAILFKKIYTQYLQGISWNEKG
jgi:Na+/proline symporter